MEARVLIDCSDKKGLVYNISKLFFELGLNIDSNSEFVDKESNKFFMRSRVSGEFDIEELKSSLIDIAPQNASIKVIPKANKNIVLMATKESHCLGDILLRFEAGELDANIKAVIANHNNLKSLVERFNIPFIHISATDISREAHESMVIEELEKIDFDYIVLAKYMRILSNEFVKKYEWKIINIHHSFLPAFIGANPYKQAHSRGVKIIGATAHFVTSNLDEGPIISQNVIPVNHNYSWRDMQKAGKDVEKVVLSKALSLVLNDRVFIYQNKTVIF
ncbi:Formyltetrahydrofolate deformylase [hydrothermal vent metagenome]|uniref:Formyltetrahydrofolate deformylase n=1 Tax=hydrothermal vent metagenome TaxID=652676 RepID=A0A1W1EJR9_9ZZZZ